jgi:hypothetical protein
MPNLPISQLPLATSGQPESLMAIVNYDVDASGITNKIYFSALTEQFSGSSGTSGSSGSSGTSGISGTSGSSGTSGISGTSGSSGTDGTSGTSGSSGSSGTSGTSGADGSSGTSGTSFQWLGPWSPTTNYYRNDVVSFSGSSFILIFEGPIVNQPPLGPASPPAWELLAQAGTNGISGSSGTSGSSGSSGTSGSSGSSGTNGTSGSSGSSGTSGTSGSSGSSGTSGTSGSSGSSGTSGTSGISLPFTSGAWGSFVSTQSQYVTSTTTAYSMSAATQTSGNGVIVSADTRFVVASAGTYNLQFSCQIESTGGGSAQIMDIWLAINGNNVDNSNTQVVGNSNNGRSVAAWNFVEPLNAGDYMELKFNVSDIRLGFAYDVAQINPTRPAIPSVIVTVTQV